MKLPISKEELKKLYDEELDEILEQCDWITYVDSHLVCSTITLSLRKHNIDIDSEQLHEYYTAEIKTMNLKEGEWNLLFGVTEIVNLIYDIIEKNF